MLPIIQNYTDNTDHWNKVWNMFKVNKKDHRMMSLIPLVLIVDTEQWCNLKLARHFWVTNICRQASKISKRCLFGRPTGRATSWKANFENYYILWYSGINFYQCSMSNTSFHFSTRFCRLLIPLKVMPYHAWVSCLIRLTINAIE